MLCTTRCFSIYSFLFCSKRHPNETLPMYPASPFNCIDCMNSLILPIPVTMKQVSYTTRYQKKKKTVAFNSTHGQTEMNFPGQSTNCSKNTIVTENTMALFNENKYQVRDAAVLFRLQPLSPQVARMQQEAI